jgi:hypothetical protein
MEPKDNGVDIDVFSAAGGFAMDAAQEALGAGAWVKLPAEKAVALQMRFAIAMQGAAEAEFEDAVAELKKSK